MKDQGFGIVPIGVFSPDPLFLLIQHQAGHWAFPKGHSEQGESPEQTARREFEEETGIMEYALLPVPTFTESYSFEKDGERVDKTVTYYLAKVSTNTVRIQEAEIKDYAWLNFTEAMQKITFDANRQILKAVGEFLQDSDRPLNS